jgi:addiction module HigA family antidote
MTAIGSDTISATATTSMMWTIDRKPFRRALGCITIPSCPLALNPTRVILSVRVPTSQPPERPGQILREEFIKTGRLTQAALAHRMGVPVTKVRGILSGEEGITAETALLLEAALGVEAEFWIRAQFVWDCYRLREVERRTAVLEHEVKGKRTKA